MTENWKHCKTLDEANTIVAQLAAEGLSATYYWRDTRFVVEWLTPEPAMTTQDIASERRAQELASRYTREEIESGRADEDMDFAGADYTTR